MPLSFALVSLDPSLRDATLADPECLRRLANRAALALVAAGEGAEAALRSWTQSLDAPVTLVHAAPAADALLFRGLAERARLAPGRLLHASADPLFLQAAEAAGCSTVSAARGLAATVADLLARDRPESLPPHPLAGRHPEPYLRGLQFFAAGRYYEAHEEWERLYVDAEGAERDFWRGLIQVAAACLQARRGNTEGAGRLWHSARILLAPLAPERHGLNLDAWLPALESWLQDAPPQGQAPSPSLG